MLFTAKVKAYLLRQKTREYFKMNTKAQLSPFTILFIALIFIIILAVGLAPIVSTTTTVALQTSGVSGIEGFIINNMLLWIIIAFIIWILWATQ